MSPLRRAFSASIGLAACTGLSASSTPSTPGQAPADPAPPPAPTADPAPPPASWVEPDRARFALLSHDPSQPAGQLVSVVLGGEGAKVLGPIEVPAMPHPLRQGTFSVVAAHDGADALAVARADGPGGPWFVDVADLGVRLSWSSVSVPHSPPAALHVVGGRVFVGHAERLSALQLSDPAGSFTELRHRAEMRGKAYDVFARHGRHLVAIDDIMMPIYADSFDLITGSPQHLAGFELPGLVNGHYQRAALLVDDSGEGRLFASAPFGHRGGWGYHLLIVPFVDGRPSTIRGGPGGVMMFSEMVHRMPDQEPSLFGGDQATAWTGLVVVPSAGRVLIAAGSRGIFSLPADAEVVATPTMHDLGGEITDVLTHEGRTWALRVGKGSTELLELDLAEPAKIGVSSTVTVEGEYRQFVP